MKGNYIDESHSIMEHYFNDMDLEELDIDSTSDFLRLIGFYDKYSEEDMIRILELDYNEVAKIIDLCNYFRIDSSPKSNVWLRTFDELVEITRYANSEDVSLPFQKGGLLYTKTVDEIKEIVSLCREYDIHDWEFDDSFNMAKDCDLVFKHKPDEIRKIIDYCKKENIFYNDQMVFEFHGLEEIIAGNELCKKLGIDFSDFLGANDEFGKELWVNYNGTQYLFDNSGKKLLRCYNPKGDIEIPSIVTEIGAGAFEGCAELHGVTIHENVNSIGSNAFKNCTGLFEVKFLGELEYFRPSTFEGCSCLRNFKWPKNLQTIGDSAFKNSAIGDGKDSDEPFVIPNTVRKIYESAFESCYNIYNLVCPDDLEEAKHRAFYDCRRLSSIKLSDNTKAFDDTLNRKLDKLVYGNCVIPGDCFIVDFINSSVYFQSGYSDYYSKIKNIHSFCCNRVRKKDSFRDFPQFYPCNCEFDDNYNEALVRIIAACPEKDIFKNIFSKMNVDIFYKNIEYLANLFDDFDYSSDLPKVVVTGNNYNLLSVSCDDARKNFEYLASQKILSYDNLKKLFFGDIDGSDFNEMLKNYYDVHKKMPPLYNSLLIASNNKNKLELRDRLVYVATMQLLDNSYSKRNFADAVAMMKRTLFENVVEHDKRQLPTRLEYLYSDLFMNNRFSEMLGIISPLQDKMDSMCDEWFDFFVDEISNAFMPESKFKKFYESLETVKNWAMFDDEVLRTTYLKNEIVARFLYADIVLTMFDNNSNGSLKVKDKDHCRVYKERRKTLRVNNSAPSIEKIFELASKSQNDLFSDPQAIRTMLQIDPYAFDALRGKPNCAVNSGDLDVNYATFAMNQGYLFSDDDMNKYVSLKVLPNKVNNFFYSITNSVCIPKIPIEKRDEYLGHIRRMSRVYVQSKSEEDLFDFCRSLDLYLRNNNEYLVQGGESVEEVAKTVFDIDGGIDNDSRILYCLFNLNRVAHNSFDLNCTSSLKNKLRLESDTDFSIAKNRLKSLFDAYNILYRVGLNERKIDILLDKDFSSDITKIIFKDESDTSLLDKKQIRYTINSIKDERIRSTPISIEEVDSIKSSLQVVGSMTDDEKEIISTSVNEQGTFFECKRLFAEEVMRKMAAGFSNDFIEMLEADLPGKQEFYATHGFVAEVQDTKNGPTLVCLCEKFCEPFSVHLKDLPDDIANALNVAQRTQTIAHKSSDGRGLTLRSENYEQEQEFINNVLSCDPKFNFVGFMSDKALQKLHKDDKTGLRCCYDHLRRSNYDNYDVPAKRIREEMTRQSSRSELDSMFSDVANNTSGINTNTGGNKHQ